VRDRGGRANYRQRSSGAISTIAGAEVEGGGLGKLPSVEEKLRWGLAGAGVQRCGGSAVAQGALRNGASRRWRYCFGGSRRF
jgi:hypothetical protein